MEDSHWGRLARLSTCTERSSVVLFAGGGNPVPLPMYVEVRRPGHFRGFPQSQIPGLHHDKSKRRLSPDCKIVRVVFFDAK